MANKTKKVDVKKVTKMEISQMVANGFEGVEGFEVLNGVNFGFTSGTLVVRTPKCDVQIKLITPKAGIEHYTEIEEEEDTEE